MATVQDLVRKYKPAYSGAVASPGTSVVPPKAPAVNPTMPLPSMKPTMPATPAPVAPTAPVASPGGVLKAAPQPLNPKIGPGAPAKPVTPFPKKELIGKLKGRKKEEIGKTYLA